MSSPYGTFQQLQLTEAQAQTAHHTTAHAKLDTSNAHHVTAHAKLDTANTHHAITSGKLTNLQTINDTKLSSIQTFLDKDSGANFALNLTNTKLDTIATNTANIKLSADSVNLNVDTLEALIGTSNTLSGTGNTTLSTLNTNLLLNNTKLDTVEASLTSMEGKHDTQITHLSEIEGAVETLENCIASNKVNVNIASGSSVDVSSLSTHAKQDTIIGHLDGVEGKLDTLETSLTSMEGKTDSLISANHSDLVALEASLTSMEGKTDTQITHLSEIEGAVETLEGCVGSNKVNVNISSGNISGFSTSSNQSTIIGHLDGVEGKQDTQITHLSEIEGAVETLEACVGSNKVNVNISSGNISGFSTSSNQSTIIGHLDGVEALLTAANTDHAANEVLLTTIDADTSAMKTSLELIDDVVKAEDAAHSSGDKGVMALAVHQTTAASLGANGDYTPLSVTSTQHLRTAKELYNFSYTFPSSGTIASGNMAESNVLTFNEKVSSGGYTFFITSSGTANHEVGVVLKGSMDGSAYFTINSSLYATGLYNDGGTTQYFTIKDFNIKNIKIQITNNSSSSDDFEVFVCH